MSEFNDWFCSLPEGRQAVLRDDKWRLADNAFQAGFEQAQAEIDALKAQNAELLAAHWEFADLVERVLPVVDYGGWCAISEELKAAIAKARGDL